MKKEIIIRFETLEQFKKRTLRDIQELEKGQARKKAYGISVNVDELPGVFTKERLKILLTVTRRDIASIKSLADILGRDYKNVYDDLKRLESLGLVTLERSSKPKKPAKPVVNYDRIILEFKKEAKA